MKDLIVLLPVLSGALWGSSGVFVRKLDEFGFDNCTILFVRIAVAVLLLFFGILITDRSMLRIKLRDAWLFVICSLFGVLGVSLCYNQAMLGLSMSLAAVLLSMAPVFVMIMATFILREKVTVRKAVCAVMAVFGCVLVSGVLESGHGLRVSSFGVVMGIISAFFYGLYSIISKVMAERRYNVFTITFYSMLIGSTALLPFIDWGMIGRFEAAAPFGSTVFLLMNSIFSSILPYILYTVSLSHMDAGKASILGSGAEPSSAMLFGLLLFSETPTILSLCGLAVTVLALGLLCAPGKSAARGAGGRGAE